MSDPDPPQPAPDPALAGYWPRPWTCEDGGPRRHGCPAGLPGLGLAPGERLAVRAWRDAFATDALVLREPGQLYALRHDVPIGGAQAGPVGAWVERLDPLTLAVTAASPRLPGGPFWPGGIAAHRDGDLHMVFGAWAHRLSPTSTCSPRTGCRWPAPTTPSSSSPVVSWS